MFKVLIIDDEPIIRKGLKSIINWRKFDCEVCGEAADGFDGGEMIRKLLPDIIITDIKMPEMDGLTMLSEIKSVVPDSKIIILTGYRDFDYVHEALKINAFDFLLKPSRIEDLTSVVSRAVKELKFNRDRAEEFDRLNTLFTQNIFVLREKLLYDVIYGINTDEEDILQKLELFKIEHGKFRMLVVQNDAEDTGSAGSAGTAGSAGDTVNKDISQYDRQLYRFGIINTFNDVFSDKFKVISITLDNVGIAFIVTLLDESEDILGLLDTRCTYLQDIIRNCFGLTVTIAISSEGTVLTQLPGKFRECGEALGHKFYIGNNSIIFHSDIDTFFKYDDHSMLEKLQKSLIEGIKSGNEISVNEKIRDIFSYVEDIDVEKNDYIKNFYRNIISLIYNIRDSLTSKDSDKKPEHSESSGLYEPIERFAGLEKLNMLLEESACGVTQMVNSYNNKSIKLILRKAVEYLRSHYREQVTLSDVAGHTFVSSYYISRMFKRETGRNFVDYLNEIRIEKAKELLKDVRFKTYEIAEMVGVPDAHYFSRLFKKHAGITPTEFREQ